MIIRALPFDNMLFHGKIKRDHIVFIPTWCDKVPHTLDFQNEEDRKRLSYGSVVLFFKTYLSVDKNGVRQEHDLAFVEELWPWETVPGKGDVLGSEFHCRRLYGAAPKKIYQVIDTGEIQERPSNNTGGAHQRNLRFFSTFPCTGCTRRFYNKIFVLHRSTKK
jgi:hypothetical protein